MSDTEIRRYEIRPGTMDAFVAWWQERIVPVRRQYGFTVTFAYRDDARSEFIWGIDHDGDFDAADQAYLDSPERADAFAVVPDGIDVQHAGRYTAVPH